MDVTMYVCSVCIMMTMVYKQKDKKAEGQKQKTIGTCTVSGCACAGSCVPLARRAALEVSLALVGGEVGGISVVEWFLVSAVHLRGGTMIVYTWYY